MTSVQNGSTKSGLSVFVYDEWVHILEKLDYNDSWNVSKVHPYFRSILQHPVENWMTLLFYKVFPLLYDYLTSKDILELRASNKQLKNIIDQFLESDQRWRNADSKGLQKVKLNLFEHPSLSRLETYTKIVDQLNSFPQAKIIGGSVFINKTLDEHDRPLDFRSLFWQFGSKIYHMTMRVKTPYNGNPVLSWKMVIDLLSHTPNLKSLCLTVTVWGQEEENGPGFWVGKLKRFFQNKKFPLLEHLVSLKLEHFGHGFSTTLEADMPPCQAFVRAYGAKLQHLNIRNMRGPIPIPRKMKCLLDLDCAIREHDELIKFKKLKAPLEKLNLIMHCGQKICYPLEHVEFLQIFAPTLKHLVVYSWLDNRSKSIAFPVSDTKKLCLPYLQKLVIYEFGLTSYPNLEFLLNFPKLRDCFISWKLENSWGRAPFEDGTYDVDHYMRTNRLIDKSTFYNCPIWNLLPNLERLELECRVELEKYKSVCTRKEYEVFARKSCD